MKKLANFTPTHSVDREEVSTYYSKDSTLAYFLNSIDNRSFCFHNIENREYCNKIALNVRKNLKNIEFFLFKTPSFNLAFAAHLAMLQEKGYTDLVYLPDDAACVTKNTSFIDEVLKYYKKTKDIKLLSLAIKSSELSKAERTLHISKNLVISLYKPSDFRNANLLDVINKPFIADIKFLIKLCDKTYTELMTKTEGDLYLRSQFLKQNLDNIACLNKRLFKCFYYNSNIKEKRIKELHLMRKLLQHKKHLV